MVFRWLNGALGDSRAAVEFAYFMEAWAPIMFVGVLGLGFWRPGVDRPRVRLIIVLAAISAILSLWGAELIASAVYRPRPFAALPESHLLIPQVEDSSFPCAAAMWSAAVAVVLLRLPKKALSWCTLTLALLIGASRPILGDHWPSDMAGSLLLGGIIGFLTSKLEKPLGPLFSNILRTLDRV